MKLPQSDWRPISAALAHTLATTNAGPKRSKPVLLEAFYDRYIRTQGRCEAFFDYAGRRDLDMNFYWDKAVQDGSTVDWDKSCFSMPSGKRFDTRIYRFHDVRYYHPDLVELLGAEFGNSEDAPSKLGRPEMIDKVLPAFLALYESGQIDCAKDLTSHYDAIRREVCARNPGLRNKGGPGNETIRKAVSVEFNEYKALARTQ